MAHSAIGRRGLLASAVGALAAPSIARAQGPNGIALVIGNSRYSWEASLPNAKRDATDMAGCFEAMGLRTELLQDAGRPAMDQALAKFTQASDGAALAAFYFAGHGAAWEKNTYLVPVDSDLSDPATVKNLIPKDAIVAATKAAQARLLVYDNCRNNPADGWRQKEALDRARGNGNSNSNDGQPSPRNTINLYSTAPGHIALDGPAGKNSPFASVLLRQLSGKTVDFYGLQSALRRQLLIETEGQQLLWGGQTFGKTYTVRGTGVPSAAPAPPPVEPARLVELKNSYAYAKEINSPLVNGMVGIRPAVDGPGAQMVGAYNFMWRGVQPFLWMVLSVPDGKRAEIVFASREKGGPFWRYIQGTVSGNSLDAEAWSGGPRFALKWNDSGGGEVTWTSRSTGTRHEQATMPFTRLDG